MKYRAPRGTHDLWGPQAEKISKLEDICRKTFQRYNFTELRIPTFEDSELFTRSIGETTDIVEKEMYIFHDRKGRKLSLRPEGTAGVVRAYLEGSLSQKLALPKLFYIGSMFRYERPQAGRYREFFQIGAEYFGNPSPAADAEIIMLTRDILFNVGLKDAVIYINTLGCAKCRPDFRQALKDYFSTQQDLCDDCKRRIESNPLRVLDCKIDSPKFNDLPKMEDHLCEECNENFLQVQELLNIAGCLYNVDHRLVRGLDYYTRTIFEVRSRGLGSQDALAAGGRYDNLVQELGGSSTPAVGFALGSERIVLAADSLNVNLTQEKNNLIFVAVSAKEFEKEAFLLVSKLKAQVTSDVFSIEGPFSEKSLKSQLRLADKLNASKVILFGEDEFKRGAVAVRDMNSKEQKEVSISDVEKIIVGI